MKLSILIPTLPARAVSFDGLIKDLRKQIGAENVELIWDDDPDISIGDKRNRLLSLAEGEYVCFIDDDDIVSSDYICKIVVALETNPDCCSLTGVITWDGNNPEIFEHSIKYKEYKTNESGGIKYERYPNHLNVIKRAIAQKFTFPLISHGEDRTWADKIHESGFLKIEATIPGVIYHYKFRTNK